MVDYVTKTNSRTNVVITRLFFGTSLVLQAAILWSLLRI